MCNFLVSFEGSSVWQVLMAVVICQYMLVLLTDLDWLIDRQLNHCYYVYMKVAETMAMVAA